MRDTMMENDGPKSITEVIAEFGDFSQSVASMACGHRKILVDGGFPVDLADYMAMSLHDKLLGILHEVETEDDLGYLFEEVSDSDE